MPRRLRPLSKKQAEAHNAATWERLRAGAKSANEKPKPERVKR